MPPPPPFFPRRRNSPKQHHVRLPGPPFSPLLYSPRITPPPPFFHRSCSQTFPLLLWTLGTCSISSARQGLRSEIHRGSENRGDGGGGGIATATGCVTLRKGGFVKSRPACPPRLRRGRAHPSKFFFLLGPRIVLRQPGRLPGAGSWSAVGACGRARTGSHSWRIGSVKRIG